MRLKRLLGAVGVLAAATFLAAVPSSAASNMSYGVTVGTVLPADAAPVKVGRETFYAYNGTFYRQVQNGYVLVPAPIGATIKDLPRGVSEKFKVGKNTYYRHGNVYFEAIGRSKFRVCEAPAGAPAEVVKAEPDAQLTVQLGDDVYLFVDGRFYLRSPDGLLGRSIPIGAVAADFPREAISVWFRDSEYFEQNGVFFRETSGGFEVVPPPWKKTALASDDALASASAN